MAMNEEIKEIYEREGESVGLTAWLEDLASWCGVGVSTAWAWWRGTRKMSSTARKLMRLREHLPEALREKVRDL